MSDRAKIAARIRALLAKTVENGCTEDEAISAAAKAAEMLARYQLTLDEVEMRETPFERHSERHDDAVGERLWKVAAAISDLTGATYWQSSAGVWPIEIHFFGFNHEVEVARYLLEICARAMRQSQGRVERENALLRPAPRRRIVLPFLDGMADRLRARILALVPPKPTGTGLVVLRDQLVKAAMVEAGIHLQDRRMRESHDHEAAYADGLRAADSVTLNRGVASGGSRGALR